MKNLIYILPKADYFTKGKRGSVAHALGVAEGMAKSGCNVTVVSGPDPDGWMRNLHPRITFISVEPSESGWFAGNEWENRMFDLIADEIRNSPPNTLVLTRYGMSNGYRFPKFFRQFPNLIWGFEVNSFMIHYQKGKYGLISKFFSGVEQRSLLQSPFIYVISDRLKQDLISRYKIPEEKILVCPNAGPEPMHDKVKPVDGKDEKIRFIYLGVFQRYYEIPELIRAFKNSDAPSSQQPELHLFGDGDVYEQSVNEAGDHPEIKFHGRYQLESLLESGQINRNTILVLPLANHFSASFVSPIKLFEYMALGLPVMASNVGQISDILEHKKTAYLYDPETPGAMEEGFRWISEHPEECARIAQNMQQVYAAKHTWTQRMQDFRRRIESRFFMEKTVSQ